ncbi:4,5-DOPA dioxygenase extradiol [Arenimonas terrae]|uniref:4,5-DOPA dioxygenase extradiol n=2 Tax=Arenimonas terrae TaxID=2546226 RepID=A0A5C4RXJ7_9GAMM|nr:4,5-DOPA dioxygenase extradiol [Arenimonas terrae]
MSGPMPVVFLGHGSPMNAIEDNAWRRSWQDLGRRLPRPKAILCVSAHWETQGVYVSAAEKPETIHDFHGFPKALFDVRYRAPGSPELAHRVAELVRTPHVHLDHKRGLDHGAWGVLAPMYPEADIPIVQLSLSSLQPGAWHYDLAKQLAPLRDEGVLVVGSGNIVHNLRLWRPGMTDGYDWAQRFDEDIADRITEGHHEGMLGYETLGPDALLAIPTPEHYLPLLYVLALQREGEPVEFFNDQVASSISMRSLLIGG